MGKRLRSHELAFLAEFAIIADVNMHFRVQPTEWCQPNFFSINVGRRNPVIGMCVACSFMTRGQKVSKSGNIDINL